MRTAFCEIGVERRAWLTIVLAGSIMIATFCPCKTAHGEQPAPSLYVPDREDFLPEYERDLANGKDQTWDQYWGWIQTFYTGNLLSAGWTKHGERSLEKVKSSENRRKLVDRYNTLGKIICREWAKDSKHGKISTTDLRRWNNSVAEALAIDDGSGAAIMKALDEVRRLAEKQMARPSPRVRHAAHYWRVPAQPFI